MSNRSERLTKLVDISTQLSDLYGNLGFTRAEEKRKWSSTYAEEFAARPNIAGATRVADAMVAPLTADRYQLEGQIEQLKVLRDLYVNLLEYGE